MAEHDYLATLKTVIPWVPEGFFPVVCGHDGGFTAQFSPQTPSGTQGKTVKEVELICS